MKYTLILHRFGLEILLMAVFFLIGTNMAQAAPTISDVSITCAEYSDCLAGANNVTYEFSFTADSAGGDPQAFTEIDVTFPDGYDLTGVQPNGIINNGDGFFIINEIMYVSGPSFPLVVGQIMRVRIAGSMILISEPTVINFTVQLNGTNDNVNPTTPGITGAFTISTGEITSPFLDIEDPNTATLADIAGMPIHDSSDPEGTPETILTSSSAASLDATTATFTFVSNDESATFECDLDNGDYSTCVSPYTTPELLAGSHVFSVRAIDSAENADLTPATTEWTIYGVNPEVTSTEPIDGETGVVIDTTVVFHFSETVPAGIRENLVVGSGPCDEECPTLSGEWSDDYQTLTYTKERNFEANTEYTVEISVSDSLAENIYELSFTTGEETTPTPSRAQQSGSIKYDCKDPSAANYNRFSISKQSLCIYGTIPPIVPTTPIDPNPTDIIFIRNLTTGSIGEDIKALQKFLNANGFPVALIGAGSIGNETIHFGPLTKASLVRFQASKGISPAIGFFGPITREIVNEMIK